MSSPVFIRHLTHYVPPTVLDNALFARHMETSDAWIQEHVGIRERRFLGDYDGEFPVFEISRRAVQRLLDTTGLDLGEIDLILSCASADDLQYPGPANLLSEHYGLRVPALNLKNACSSVVYGIEVARGLLQLGTYRNVLLVNGEPFTLQADWTDRSSAILFGDAASALVVSSRPGPMLVEDVALGGLGSRVINSTAAGAAPHRGIHDVLACESACPSAPSRERPRWGRFQQQGREVVSFVTGVIPGEILEFLATRGLGIRDVDYFIGHQANLALLRGLCEKIGLPQERHLHNIDRYGNTSSAGWVTVLSEALEQQRVRPGDRLLVAAYGGGLAWGIMLCRVLDPSEH